jgi:hypothetical protein
LVAADEGSGQDLNACRHGVCLRAGSYSVKSAHFPIVEDDDDTEVTRR